MNRFVTLGFVMVSLGCAPAAVQETLSKPGPAGEFPITVRDDLKRSVTVSVCPRRVVSLAPAITETLFTVGAGPRVVAVTTTDTEPAEVKRLPTIGGFAPETISVEAILAQKPDLVIGGGKFQEPVVEALSRLGVPALVFDPASLDRIEDTIVLIGRLTGAEAKAGEVVSDIRRRREAVRKRAASLERAERRRVLYVLWDEPLQTAGPDTFVGQMIVEAGGQNVFADAKQQYPAVSDEAVLARNPDLILATDHGGVELRSRLARRPGWDRLSAIQARRVVTVPEDLLHRPGPRIIDGLERLAALLGETP
jgi:iron complex transport system substrate-binding protein